MYYTIFAFFVVCLLARSLHIQRVSIWCTLYCISNVSKFGFDLFSVLHSLGYTEFVFVICGDAEHRRGGRGWANVRI